VQFCSHGVPVKFNNCWHCQLEQKIEEQQKKIDFLKINWEKIHNLEKEIEENWDRSQWHFDQFIHDINLLEEQQKQTSSLKEQLELGNYSERLIKLESFNLIWSGEKIEITNWISDIVKCEQDRIYNLEKQYDIAIERIKEFDQVEERLETLEQELAELNK
jgi:hypothetical protein